MKKDEQKTREQLLNELGEMRQRVAELEALEAKHRQAEKALTETQERFLTILSNIDAHVYAADMETYEILFMNRQMQDDFGGNLVGEICWDVFRGESRPCAHCTNDKLVDADGNPTGVYVWEGHNPITQRWYMNYDRAIVWDEGRLVRLQIATDITERKRAEQARRESEEKYRTILDNIEDAYFEVDLAGNLTFFNDPLCRTIGYSRDELMGMNNRQYMDEENARKVFRAFNQIYTTGKPARGFDWELISKDGTKRFMEVSASLMRNSEGEPIGFRGIARDITERKQAEEALRKNEECLRRQNRILVEVARSEALERGDLEAALKEITVASARTLNVARASVWLYDEERSKIRCVAQYELSKDCHSAGYELTAADYPSYFKALEEERIIAAHDAYTDPRTREFSDSYLSPFGITSMLDAPARLGGRVIGVICHEHVGPARRWSLEEQNFAASMADFVSLAIEGEERKQAEEEIRRHTARLEALRQVGLELTIQLDLDTLLRAIVSRAVELLGCNSGAMDLYRPDQDVLEWTVSVGMDHPSLRSAQGSPLRPGSGHGSGHAPKPILRRGEGLCGQVWETGEPLIVNDYHHWEGRRPGWEGYPFQAAMGVPVRWGEEFLGVLQVGAPPPRTFSPADVELLSMFAAQAATAIRNARLYEEAHRRAERLTVVNRIARAIGATLDLDHLMETVYHEVVSIFQADAFFIALYDREANELDYCLQVDDGVREPRERQPVGTGLTSLIVMERKPLLVRDMEREQDGLPTPQVWGTMKLPASWLGVPMTIGDRVVGVISVQAYRPHAYGQEEQQFLSTIADQVAMAVEKARLYEEMQRQSERLAQTLVTSEWLHRGLELEQVLEQITQGMVRLGFRRAVINVCQPGEELVRARAVVGLEGPERETLMQATYRWSDFQALMQKRFQISRSYLIRHGEVHWSEDFQGVVVTPNIEDRGPGYWHPEDMLLVPLWGSRSEPVGLLSVDEPVDGLLPNLNTVQTLEAFANQAAIAIENARLFEEEKRRVTQLALINEVGDKAASILDLDTLMQEVARSIQESFNYYNVTLLLLDEGRREMVMRAIAGGFKHIVPGEYRQSLNEGIIGFVARTGQSRLANDVSRDPYYVKGFLGEVLTQSELVVPIKLGDRVIGALDVHSIRLNDFDQSDVVAMEAVADRVAIAIQNARLYEAEQQRRRDAEALRETALALTSALDRNQVVERILTQLQQVVPYDSASVQLLHGDRLVITGGRGFLNLKELRGISFPVDGDTPNREVMRTRAPFIVHDASAVYEGFRQGPHMQTVIRSWLGVPMLIGERLVGMIALDKSEPGFYTEEHASLAQTFAAQAAIAIENARLFEEVEKRRVYLEGVLGAAPDAIVTFDAHDQIVEWNPGAEGLFGYSQEEVIGRDIDDLVTGPDVLAEATGFTQMVMGGGEVPPTETVRYRKDGTPVDVIVAGSPILVEGELIGAVAVYTDISQQKRMEEELRAMALIDDLTGLYNRRGFLTLGQQQLRMANRMKRRMLLLFADYDGLKKVNDSFGHAEGDRALIEVAHVLQETFRESDIVARIAGDEFVVLALETVDDSAEILAARLQTNVAARNARGDLRYQLSLSVGVACYDPEAPCLIDDLVAQADRAMYEQKRSVIHGRDVA